MRGPNYYPADGEAEARAMWDEVVAAAEQHGETYFDLEGVTYKLTCDGNGYDVTIYEPPRE